MESCDYIFYIYKKYTWSNRKDKNDTLDNFLDIGLEFRDVGIHTVSSPGEDSHCDDHEGQNHTQNNTTDGQLDRTVSLRRGTHTHTFFMEQEGGRKLLYDGHAVFCGFHLTSPLPVVVLLFELNYQSDVAGCRVSQFVPA